jgi:hypothetical protein
VGGDTSAAEHVQRKQRRTRACQGLLPSAAGGTGGASEVSTARSSAMRVRSAANATLHAASSPT